MTYREEIWDMRMDERRRLGIKGMKSLESKKTVQGKIQKLRDAKVECVDRQELTDFVNGFKKLYECAQIHEENFGRKTLKQLSYFRLN